MLNIKFRETEDDNLHPMQALAPWLDFVTPNIILNKDGSLLAGFNYEGVDPDDLFTEQVNGYAANMQTISSRLDSRITAWWIVDKRKDNSYVEGHFENATAQEIDRLYSKNFTSGAHKSMRYSFYMLFTGSTGTDKFFDRVGRIQKESGKALGPALMAAVAESLSDQRAFAADQGTLFDNVQTFERILAGFVNAATIKLRRLSGDDFSSALGAILNRASAPVKLKKPAGTMLDGWLPREHMAKGDDVLLFRGAQRSIYAGAVGIKEWPGATSPMLFESLAALDIEMTLCQVVRYLNVVESQQAIKPAIEYFKLTQYNLVAHALAKAVGDEPEAKAGKASQVDACKDALERIGAEGVTFAWMAMTVFVYADTREELKLNCDRVVQTLEHQEFGAVRERLNVGPAFASLLPGQWATQSRYGLMSIENVADSYPIYTMGEGPREHKFFSKSVYRESMPQMAVFGNRYGGRFNYSSHVDQVGHQLIIAPTGSGKSTFVNFCLSQFQRYGIVNTFIFDRNRSCEVVTKLHGGQHIDIKKAGTKLNPLAVLRDGSPDGKVWVREYILRRLAEGGFVANANDRAEIDKAIDLLVKRGGPVSMSRLAAHVPTHIESELSEWLQGRPYGMFDNEEDDLSLSSWTTIEMSSILSVDRVARAFIDLIFRKIYSALDGRPTLIYIEEASFLLNDPRFAPMIDEWLKAVRGRNGFVWLTIQSPQSVTHAEMSATILDNIYTFLLLRNEKVETHREAYRDNFGFQDHQINLLPKLQAKRDYLLIQDGHARVMQTHFSPETLAYLRSEKAVLNVWEKYEQEQTPGWQDRFLAEVTKM